MKEIIAVLANLSTLVFVISSMLAMGLSLTVKQIIEPLQDLGLVIRVLLANFLLVTLLAYLLKTVIPLEESFTIGLTLLATTAGVPFLPKLAQAAKGNLAFSERRLGRSHNKNSDAPLQVSGSARNNPCG